MDEGRTRRRSRWLTAVCAIVAPLLAVPGMGEPASSEPASPSDLLVTGTTTPTGYVLQVASAASGWAARVVASIGDPTGSSGAWTGQECVTGDAAHIGVVAYPVSIASSPSRAGAGLGFVVDVATNRVTAVPGEFSPAYHDPGCGPGDLVAFSGPSEAGGTRAVVVSASTGTVQDTFDVAGQLTSVRPAAMPGRVIGSRATGLVEVDASGERSVAQTDGVPFRTQVAPDGVLAFQTVSGDTTLVTLLDGDGQRTVATGTAGALRLQGLSSDDAILTGAATSVADEADVVVAEVDAEVSTQGGAVAVATDLGPVVQPLVARRPAGIRRVAVARTPVVPSAQVVAAVASTPSCSVERNNPARMARQPTAEQVRWAIEQAVLGNGAVLRGAGYIPNEAAYRPFVEFPPTPLVGGGRIPLSVAYAVFAQESNWQQASRRALPGVSANPMVASYFGSPYGDELATIDYANADCGYGVAQVTSGMRRGDTVYSPRQQRLIALDHAANVAAGLQILAGKWNQLAAHGVLANGGSSTSLESWYFALWAYNTGYHERGEPDAAGDEGLGWLNNPANPDYPPDRSPFLRATYDDARHPIDWPYQERVIGWMESPLRNGLSGDFYRGTALYLQLPPRTAFCDARNRCEPTAPSVCTLTQAGPNYYHCWWSTSVSWVDCPRQCTPSADQPAARNVEPAGADFYPPNCATLPTTPNSPGDGRRVVVVEEVPAGTPNVEGCGPVPNGDRSNGATYGGTFRVTFKKNPAGVARGEIDWHQLGSGFGGHTYFTDTWDDPELRITGRWTPPPLNGTYTVWAHVPPTGATAPQVRYAVFDGTRRSTHDVDQGRFAYVQNSWVSIATTRLGAGAYVELTNQRFGRSADGGNTVAFDAIAFTPALDSPHLAVLGDSYASSEGIPDYEPATDIATPENRCHRSLHGFATIIHLPGRPASDTRSYACSGAHTVHLTTTPQYGTQAVQLALLDSSTQVVVVSSGGNDLGGAAARSDGDPSNGLGSMLGTCHKEAFHPFDGCRIGSSMDAAVQARAVTLYTDLVDLYRQIKARAPNARILAVGYPRLFSTSVARQIGYEIEYKLEVGAQQWMNDVADRLDTVIALAADAAGISFLDLRGPFDRHDVTQGSTYPAANWIAPLIAGHSNCALVAECGSYHPNSAGTAAYATLIQQWIDQGTLPPRSTRICPTGLNVRGCRRTGGGGSGW